MTSLINRLDIERKKAREEKNNTLASRIIEAKREIEYFNWTLNNLNHLDDASLVRSFREFVDLTNKGYRLGLAHHIFRR